MKVSLLALISLWFSVVISVPGQTLACRPPALAAWRPVPELKYECRDDLTESDERVLSQTNRREALRAYAAALEKYDFADWWRVPVADLNACAYRRRAGAFTAEERQAYENGEFYFELLGNQRFRVVIAKDPCYQGGYSGSDFFLLNRAEGKVRAAQIIDGFYTRSDYPPVVAFATVKNRPVIEIATTSGGLYPTETSYYFTIDPRTNRAVPLRLFLAGRRPTHTITSRMLLGEPEEYGLPPRSAALEVIKNNRLQPSFSVFQLSPEKTGDGGEKFERIVYRWNGKYYRARKT
jgi:hypothetical protein